MEHLKKNWGYYLAALIILLAVAYQMKWFGNEKGIFAIGGRVGLPGGGGIGSGGNVSIGVGTGVGHGPDAPSQGQVVSQPIVTRISQPVNCESLKAQLNQLQQQYNSLCSPKIGGGSGVIISVPPATPQCVSIQNQINQVKASLVSLGCGGGINR